jgi:hypothetical protein
MSDNFARLCCRGQMILRREISHPIFHHFEFSLMQKQPGHIANYASQSDAENKQAVCCIKNKEDLAAAYGVLVEEVAGILESRA